MRTVRRPLVKGEGPGLLLNEMDLSVQAEREERP